MTFLNIDTNNPPDLMFTDFDGTLYDHGLQYLTSMLYNFRTSQIIRRNNIKLIITTGRPSWGRASNIQNRLLGMHAPDVMIRAAGTHIYYKDGDSYTIDVEWEDKMKNSVIQWVNDGKTIWSREEVVSRITPILHKSLLTPETQNFPYVIRIPLFQTPVKVMLETMDELRKLWTSGIKIIYTEKLYLLNTTEVFGGYLFLVPELAGKDGSAQYLINKYKNQTNQNPNSLFFGDASVDVPMLINNYENLGERSKRYGLHLTPLAQEDMKEFVDDATTFSLKGSPPKSILKVLKQWIKEPSQ